MQCNTCKSILELYFQLEWKNYFVFFFFQQKFAPECVDAKFVPITDKLKQVFVDGHNRFRNEQALGKTGELFLDKTVADMATVVSLRMVYNLFIRLYFYSICVFFFKLCVAVLGR